MVIDIDDGIPIIFLIICSIVGFLIWADYTADRSEISAAGYEEIVFFVAEFPVIEPAVKDALADDVVTTLEYKEILSQYQQIKHEAAKTALINRSVSMF